MDPIMQLKDLYAKNSKHSNYQILSNRLSKVIGDKQIDVKSRSEQERFDYISNKIGLNGKNILDIGGNSGFFTFEAIEKGARCVHHYEGNKEHSNFVKKAAEVLQCGDKVEVTNSYYKFGTEEKRKYDVIFLLNVLHHLGDDFGDNSLSIDAAKNLMANHLNVISDNTEYLIFQLGFCWKGDRNVGLFKNGTKEEMIDFVKSSIGDNWIIEGVGIPVLQDNNIQYNELNEENILRNDKLGEFLNRPLFILKSTL